MQEQSDESIAFHVQKGATEQFGTLIERYEQRLMRYAKKFLLGTEDAEDLVQETFIKAFTNIRGFDVKRKFSSWVYRIAHNEFINALKKKHRAPLFFFDPDVLFPHPVSKENPDHDINKKEVAATIEQGLERLKPHYREILVLYYIEELSYQEIADILRIPVSTVGVRLRRGRDALKKIIPQD